MNNEVKIKPILYHRIKGRKMIRSLILERINSDNQKINVSYEELPKFLKIDELNKKNDDKKIIVKLKPSINYGIKGRKMIRTIICDKILDDNQISSDSQINISFQKFNEDNYKIELFENNEEAIKKLKKLEEVETKLLNLSLLLNSTTKKIQELLEPENEYTKLTKQKEQKETKISNILEWGVNLTTLSAGVTSLVPTIGTISSASCTMLSAGFSIANSIMKNKNNKIDNLEESANNFEITNKICEINAIHYQNEPSTSGYKPRSPQM